jgi:glycosyltransferase involved in cell wall biosynthesis
MKIPCTIGMLTYNSEKNLPRALASVADFAEVIIADGGSTDATLAIARQHGARVIPQSNSGNPIADFSKERSLTLAEATQPWFFYLDSDEIMSKELVEHIRTIASDALHASGAYRVRYLKTNADASKIYRTYREYYQIRLVRTDVGAHFERPVHERIVVPHGVKIGQTEAPWYVPLDEDDLAYSVFIPKAWGRTAISARDWKPRGIRNVCSRLIVAPVVAILKSVYKIIAVRVKWGNEAIPARYEILRIFYAFMLFIQDIRRLLFGRTRA